MAQQNFSYLLFELSALLCAWLALYSIGAVRTLLTRRFLSVAACLYAFWVGWDFIAVKLGVFQFPATGSLPLRIAGLPVEEHLFFLVHTISVWALVVITETAKHSSESVGHQ